MVIYLDQYDPPKPYWMMSISDLIKHNKKCIRLDQRSNFKWKTRKKRRKKTRNKRNRKTRKRNKLTKKNRFKNSNI